MKALDEHSLEVLLEGPTGYFLLLYWLIARLSQSRDMHVEAHGEDWTHAGNLVSNGAFILESRDQGESMVLARNPAYHGNFKGNLQQVELSSGIRKSLVLQKYESGNLDVLGLFDLPPSEWDRARRQHAGEYVSSPKSATYYVGFDVSRPPFDDARVRWAFAMATDKTQLATAVFGGYWFPAMGGFVPPGMPGHSSNIGLLYNPDGARQLLAGAKSRVSRRAWISIC